jgi:sugar O-acyltransferase (sialic acid O-acetyltransferase NeuD family)
MPDNEPRDLVIFGGGTLARLAHAYFTRDSAYEVVACTAHREHLAAADLAGLPTVPFDELERSYQPTQCSMFVAVGYTEVNKARARIFQECISLGYHMATLVSPRAHCWSDLVIGRNCLVFDGVVIEPNVQIGDDVIVWSSSQISHDSIIGDHCFLGPSSVILGDVTVGPRSFIGGNATVRNGVTVAEDCVIGAGAVIKQNTEAGAIYATGATTPDPARRSQDLREL